MLFIVIEVIVELYRFTQVDGLSPEANAWLLFMNSNNNDNNKTSDNGTQILLTHFNNIAL